MLEKTLSTEKTKQNPYNHQSRQQPEINPASLHFLTKSSAYSPGPNGKAVHEVDYSYGNGGQAYDSFSKPSYGGGSYHINTINAPLFWEPSQTFKKDYRLDYVFIKK